MTSRLFPKKYSPCVSIFSSPWAVIGLFALLGLIGILNHVMWRDEFNTWLIVRDSQSLMEMLGRVKYQGHTALWALCVSFIRNFSQSPTSMQLLHWALAVLSMSVFWFFSPFAYRQKVLFTFGYIPFYQYLLIARPYVLGMLSLFIFCALFPRRQKSYIPAALLLALMANSNAYGLFISGALLLMLALEFALDAEARSRYLEQASIYDLLLSLLVVAIGYGAAVYILIPPADSYNHGGIDAWRFTFDLRRGLSAWGRLFGGYTLIVPSSKRWIDLLFCGCITLLIVVIFALRLVKKPLVLCFWGIASLEIIAFSYFRFLGGGPRHYGHFFLILIAAFWLASQLPESTVLTKRLSLPSSWFAFGQKWCTPLLTSILVFQFLGGLYGLPRDLLIPFSASQETVRYIRASGWQDAFIVASRDANMAAIAGYLNRKLYYPELRAMGSFTLYGGDRREVSQDQVLEQVVDLLLTQPTRQVLLLLHKPLEAENSNLEIDPIQEFTHTWTDTERFYLYNVVPTL